MFIDFALLKETVTVTDVASMLDLSLKQCGDTYRGPCPVCESDNERCLVLSPSKRSFYCFASRTGGDVIALVAHIKGLSMKESAKYILDHNEPKELDSLQPLTHLEEDHEAVKELGIAVPAAEAIGIGYAKKGIMRGRIAFPLRLADGTLVGYIGVLPKTDIKLPKSLEEK